MRFGLLPTIIYLDGRKGTITQQGKILSALFYPIADWCPNQLLYLAREGMADDRQERNMDWPE